MDFPQQQLMGEDLGPYSSSRVFPDQTKTVLPLPSRKDNQQGAALFDFSQDGNSQMQKATLELHKEVLALQKEKLILENEKLQLQIEKIKLRKAKICS